MKSYVALISAAIGLVAFGSVHAGFYPDDVNKLCTALPAAEGGMPNTANENLLYFKCYDAQANFLDNLLKKTMERAIASEKIDPETKEMLQQDYSKRYGSSKKKSPSPKLTRKTPLKVLQEASEEADERRADTTLAIMKVLSILYPSKYPYSRYRKELEEQDLEDAFNGTFDLVQNKPAVLADQEAWNKKTDEFCSTEVFFWISPTTDVYEQECKNIMTRIRTEELAAQFDKLLANKH